MSLVILVLQLVIAAIVIFFSAVYLYYKYKFQHWSKRGIPHTTPTFPSGDLQGLRSDRSAGDIYIELYNKTKHEKVCGFWAFFTPHIIINDPQILKDIFIKDFNAFSDRGAYVDLELDPLAGHLFFLDGTAWKNLRVKLTPTFTSGKMKMMYPTVVETGEELVNYLQPLADKKKEVDVKELTARYTTDVIATCAFGIKAASIKDPNAIFRRMGQRAVNLTFAETMKASLKVLTPDLAKFLKVKAVPSDVETFFMGAIKETIEFRMKNNVERQDFMQLLIQLMEKGYIDEADLQRNKVKGESTQKFTFNEAAAQAFVFFIAGFETSSATIQFTLYELAKNQTIQTRLQEEIDTTLADNAGNLTYEAVLSMEYLDRVVSESLRKYPPSIFLLRYTTKDYKISGTQYLIEKGTPVHISVIGLHQDERYFPDPDKFDPQRFSPEEKEKRPHCVYVPFGEGPRICIGNRFALIQIKVCLALLLKYFNFNVSDKTPSKVTYDKSSFILAAEGGMHLEISMRK